MLRHERHIAILRQLEKTEAISLEQLLDMVDASESTLRRDIDHLASTKQLRKIRGGIASIDQPQEESRLVTPPFSAEELKNADAKKAIGKAAAALLSGNESIIINGGTTTYHIAENLPASGLTILTNSLPIVDYVSRQTTNRCFVSGGEVFHNHMIILGHLESETPNFFGDYFFTGCQGISPWGIMEGDPLLVHAEQKLIGQSEKLVILADSSKFTTRKSIIMCPLDKVHAVVTDENIDDNSRKMLEDQGIQVIIAQVGPPRKPQTPKSRCLALDFGASSGRLVEVELDNTHLAMRELIRMDNTPRQEDGSLCWQHDHLFSKVVEGLCIAGKSGKQYESIGVDTWGVDYVLLDENGSLLNSPVTYRDKRTQGLIEQFSQDRISREQIYDKTGIQFLEFNTLYQLYAQSLSQPELLAKTHRLLFTADYFHFLLSGTASVEATMASTSQMLNIHDNNWDTDLIETLALPADALPAPVKPGSEIGTLLPELRAKTGLSSLRVIAPATHDTASAILAVPASGDNWAYLSSGTWSLLGVELNSPITSPEALTANWTNEGGYDDTYRFLKNINGLWIIQEIVRNLDNRYSFAELAEMAAAEPGFSCLIDPSDMRFFSPSNMVHEIQEFCRETHQTVPQTPGALARCAYDSLSLLYRKTLGQLVALTGRTIQTLHVVGGGSQADLLNQLTASAIGIPVLAGPVEATALGNALAQFLATGAISSVDEARKLIHTSFPPRRFDPEISPDTDQAYARFLELHSQTSKSAVKDKT